MAWHLRVIMVQAPSVILTTVGKKCNEMTENANELTLPTGSNRVCADQLRAFTAGDDLISVSQR